MPVPVSTTPCSISCMVRAVSADTTVRWVGSVTIRSPSWGMISLTTWGCTQTPSLAIVAYTAAIWSGVTPTR